MQTIHITLFYSQTQIKLFKYLLFHGFKNLLEIHVLLFFKFSINHKFLQWPFNRCLCLLVFGTKIAKLLRFLFNN